MAENDPTFSVEVVRVVLAGEATPVMANIAAVFKSRVERRCRARVVTHGDAALTIELATAPGIGAEGFRIEDGADGVIRIVGADQRGVLYGVGKLLRTSRYDQGGFSPSQWRGSSVPAKSVRGMYFATHFGNYYHTAPVEEVQRYIEDLVLWGVNCLVMWYDMHHFQGADDPEAVVFRERLKRFAQTAGRLGVGVGFGVIGNEAYGNSPEPLRAAPGGGRGGYYPVAVCPNKPGGMAYILKVVGDHLDWSRDLKPEFIWIWPYDQGGCGCASCRPWGANGFLMCAKKIAGMAREKLAGVKIILSTWLFDEKEWRGLEADLAANDGWVDMILSEDPLGPSPGGLPCVGFPEISMHNTFPWGGFGATPLTQRFRNQWREQEDKLAGGFPYSEGIFEDLTKVVCAQLYWDSKTLIEEILAEYVAYEYSPEATNAVLQIVTTLERNHHMRWWPGELEGVELMMNWFPSRGAKPQADPGAEEAYAAVKQVDATLPTWARTSWRWRILYIRAMLDAELKANGGSPNEACIKGFRELMRIYHTTEESDPVVKPPVRGVPAGDRIDVRCHRRSPCGQ